MTGRLSASEQQVAARHGLAALLGRWGCAGGWEWTNDPDYDY